MARAEPNTSIVPSILDRLLDEDPGVTQEPMTGRFQGVRGMERAVARDLETLLNTRQEILQALPDEFAEVNNSLLTYGLPDLSSFSLDSEDDRGRVRRVIEQAIANCEPRLERVQVILHAPRENERGLRFRIDALLRVDPAPEPVTFDAMLQLNTQQYIVRGQD
ncbi:MAG TPA: type VI secretion system baseplate subunit TssE [Candidatus Saccharimonadales bacterium]|nr:type VI secretion system baseplate subunit TssE [Candidatus Saccharimonadales bacterium]